MLSKARMLRSQRPGVVDDAQDVWSYSSCSVLVNLQHDSFQTCMWLLGWWVSAFVSMQPVVIFFSPCSWWLLVAEAFSSQPAWTHWNELASLSWMSKTWRPFQLCFPLVSLPYQDNIRAQAWGALSQHRCDLREHDCQLLVWEKMSVETEFSKVTK